MIQDYLNRFKYLEKWIFIHMRISMHNNTQDTRNHMAQRGKDC